MDTLEKLTQRGSVAKYVEKFEHLRTQITGVSNELWKRYFVKGLSPTVQLEAIKFKIDNPTAPLACLYQRVTTIGDALWSHRVYRDDPMDLSAIMTKTNGRNYAGYRDPKKSSGSLASAGPGKDSRKCFKCGKPGHIQRFCRAPVKVNGIDYNAPSDSQTPVQDKSEQDFQ